MYILVFGESLLNDAVTIVSFKLIIIQGCFQVLYNTFRPFGMEGANEMKLVDVLSCLLSFFSVSFGGIAFGLLFGCLTGLVMKYTKMVKIYQPLLCLLIPYCGYCGAESASVSGILA